MVAKMQLTKTDFIQYLKCPKSLWLLKHEPENYPAGEFSAFLEKITREGYQVEGYVKEFFQHEKTRFANFQSEFSSIDGLFARADVIEITQDGETILYEVKSSNRVKKDNDHNHVKDACFQKICAERSGQAIDKVFIVHLNGNYVRNGDINPSDLLIFSDVTDQVGNILGETKGEIDSALELLQQDNIDRDSCSCLQSSRANHCDTFSMFNPNVPVPSIYSLPRLSARKRDDLIGRNIFALNEIPEGYSLSDIQQTVLAASKSGEPQINIDSMREFLGKFEFPLYFLDYETFASAIPITNGSSPHKHFPFQYSLHILSQDGEIKHREYLERKCLLPLPLIEQMEKDIGCEGSVVSWHASFEKTQNKEMSVMFREKEGFLLNINERMVDLEDVFKKDYVDFRFDGSTSIKKILPVVCPHLSYNDLEIKDGSLAMEAWERMISSDPEESQKIASNLLKYCKLDTFAMVEIYRFLNAQLAVE